MAMRAFIAGSASAPLHDIAKPAAVPVLQARLAQSFHACVDHTAGQSTVSTLFGLPCEVADVRGGHGMRLGVVSEMVKDCRIQGYNRVSHWWA